MNIILADTYTASLARLSGPEQKAAKEATYDLQTNPAAPGLQMHRLDRARDQNFWSARVNSDLRIILHKTDGSVLFCYVDHHDKAYAWAERRRIERHQTTGAMQIVEIREKVIEIPVMAPVAVPVGAAAPSVKKPVPFEHLRKTELLGFGVPADWVEDVRNADEDRLLELLPHLPAEAQEALLRLAVGERPDKPEPVPPVADPFQHPDAQRRFLIVSGREDLERALESPWESWAVFLHPDQRRLVSRQYGGPARVSGSAGTGKTVVALHRAVALARRNPGAKVLLATFSKPLANALRRRLETLVRPEPDTGSRITVHPITGVGYDLYARRFGAPNIAPGTLVASLLKNAAAAEQAKFSPAFLMDEWRDVVDAWGIQDRDSYLNVPRLGRKTRIGGKQRELLWTIFERVRAGLDERNVTTWSQVFLRLASGLSETEARPFDFAVIDEAQDIGVAELRFLAALGAGRPDGLFFAGDIGQRIFQQPFSWKAVGVDVRGRSFTLKVNYRTSQQIRMKADRLLPSDVADVDGNSESRKGTVSVFDGPEPTLRLFPDPKAEAEAVGGWIADRLAQGMKPEEIGVVVRTEAQLKRARDAVKAAGAKASELSEKVEISDGHISITTMHLAKGLEFRAVAVIACDEDVVPSIERMESVSDESDLDEVFATERHLLYVACTRARDELMVTAVAPGSEFLADLGI